MKLQEELHVSKLSASNSAKNVILLNISDKKQSLTEVSNKDFLEIDVEKLSNKAIKTNTTDVLATDIYHNEVAYYFKHKKLSYLSHTITYNTDVHEPSGQLIYSNERYVTAEIKDVNGNLVSKLELEFVPIFIDKRLTNLKSYIDIDGKYFTPKRKNDKILISFSMEVSEYKVNNSIFVCDRFLKDNLATLALKEFLYVQNKNIQNKNCIVEYDYLNPYFTLIRKAVDFIEVNKSGYCYLANKNIDISSVSITSINNVVANININKFVQHSSGKICILELINSNVLNHKDIIEITYNYLHKDEQYIDVDINKLNGDSKIHSYVGATKIKTPTGTTESSKSFNVFISQNNFIVTNIFDYTSINIAQSGTEYVFDYSVQNQISFTPPGSIEQFYTNNTGSIDTYLNDKHYKECGTFTLSKIENEFIGVNKSVKQKDLFFEPSKIIVNKSSIVVAGNGDTEEPAGIKKIKYQNVFPLNFFIDHKTTSNIFIKLNIAKELLFNTISTDTDIINFCIASDEINKNYGFNPENFKLIYINNNTTTEIVPIFYMNNTTKDLYLKGPNIANNEIRIGYADAISNYGFLIWKNLYKTQII